MQSCSTQFSLARRRTFSLAELLIAIGIIILVLALAVPAFNVLTGSRSIESATNIISASTARARLAAIRDQQPHGLIFYRDPSNDRVAVALAALNTTNNAIDVVPGSDVQYLPAGISTGFRHSAGSTYTYRMTGDAEDLYGLILFNARGHVMHSTYEINENTEIGRRLGLSGSNIVNISGEPLISQPAFALFERGPFEAQTTDDQHDWIETNASFLLINRYNGTLTRSE